MKEISVKSRKKNCCFRTVAEYAEMKSFLSFECKKRDDEDVIFIGNSRIKHELSIKYNR